MQISVTFKNLDSSNALRSYVEKKLDRFDKLFDNPAEANVVFSVEKIRHTAEINLVSDRVNIHAKEETENMYSSIDMVVDKLKKQITKNRDKVNQRRINSRESIKHAHLMHEEEPSPEDEDSDLIDYEDNYEAPMDGSKFMAQ